MASAQGSCLYKSLVAAGACLAAGTLTACTALPPESGASALQRSVVESLRQELDAEGRREPGAVPMVRSGATLDLSDERFGEIREMSGPTSYEGMAAPMSDDLLGRPPTTRPIGLREALRAAIENNLSAGSARLGPPIARTDLIAAQAVFDWVVFASVDRVITDEEQPIPIVGMTPVGAGQSRSDQTNFETGVRKQLTTGGVLTASTTLDIFNNSTTGFSRSPDPAYTSNLNIGLTQPLLRGFGREVNLAEVWLAENETRRSLEDLRSTLLGVVTETERAYWNLLLTRRRLLIQQRLLERGIQTRDALEGRLGFDVTGAELADAVARVENRRADVIRAGADLRAASDALKRLINAPTLPVEGEAVLIPSDDPASASVRFSLIETLADAFEHRPEVRQAFLRIDDAAIRERVADNARLPQLDLSAQLALFGLEDDAGGAFEESGDANFVDVIVGLVFEYPLGNREAEARFRGARLERLRSAIDYRDVAQGVIVEVKAALRSLSTNYRLIEQTRIARQAAAENLRALLAEEETIRALTPDFLNLKLNRQEALAQAEFNEAQALVEYAVSLAEVYDAAGSSLRRLGVVVDPEALEDRATRLLDESADDLRSRYGG